MDVPKQFNSCYSIESSSSHSTQNDNDNVLRDCFNLQQRLIETEKSLENIHTNTFSSSDKNSRISSYSPPSENPPVLTLADLTPTASISQDTNIGDRNRMTSFLHSSLTDMSYKEKNAIAISSFPSSSSTDSNSLRKKLSVLREENSVLFLQNNKLLTQLENATYQLRQCKEEMRCLSKNSKDKTEINNENHNVALKLLEDQIDKKSYAIKELENLVFELRTHLKEKSIENEVYSEQLQEKHGEYLDIINKLNKKSDELEVQCKNYIEKVTSLETINNQLEEDHKCFENKIHDYEERNIKLSENYKHASSENLQHRNELIRLRENILALQHKVSETESLKTENIDLEKTIKCQQESLDSYKTEIYKTQQHMKKLEGLIQKIQEDKLSGSRPDSGIGIYRDILKPTNYSLSHSLDEHNSPRLVIADLKLKLALKDKELTKLNKLMSSSSFNQQKNMADLNVESCHLSSLRSDLSSVMEKTRITDQKQINLEQQITRLEEELSLKTSIVVELKERITNKTTLNAALENKLNMRNTDIIELKESITKIEAEHQKKQSKLHLSVEKLQKQCCSMKLQLEQTCSQLKEKQTLSINYSNRVTQLETLITSHRDETQQTNLLVENMKVLHLEHSVDLEKQIENLNEQLQTKSVLVVNLENKLRSMLNNEQVKNEKLEELNDYVSKMESLLNEKKILVTSYEDKLKVIQETSDADQINISQLLLANKTLKNELDTSVNKLTKTQNDFKSKGDEVFAANIRVKELEENIDEKSKQIIVLEKSLSEHLEMLEQNQIHISELEETLNQYLKESTTKSQDLVNIEGRLKQEIANKETDLFEMKKLLKMYQEQNEELNEALNGAKLKLVGLGKILQDNQEKMANRENFVAEQAYEIESSVKVLHSIQTELDKKIGEVEEYNKILNEKNCITQKVQQENIQLKEKIADLEENSKRASSKLYQCDINYAELLKQLSTIKDSKIKLERMISIMRDDANIREEECKETKIHVCEMENVLKQQELIVKQKATQLVKLEMTFKQEKSELEKSISLLEDAMKQLRTLVLEKDSEISKLLNDKKVLQNNIQASKEVCEEYKVKHQIHDDINLETAKELKILQEELNICQVKIKDYIHLEEELSSVSINNQQLRYEVQCLEGRLIVSEQTVFKLTQELQDSHSTLSTKEADCTRLARELGSSQVREAQEKSRLNQIIHEVKNESDFQLSENKEELDSLSAKHEKITVKHQQELMTLKLALQRSDDENKLCKNDISRFKHRVEELESEVKSLMNELLVEQKKCKGIDEAMVIREAEMTRYSARLNGFERSIYKNQSSNVSGIPTFNTTESNFQQNLHSSNENDKFDYVLKNAENELNRQSDDVQSLSDSTDLFSNCSLDV